jgi:hypothetical protein
MSWWEQLTAPLGGGQGGPTPVVWAGVLLAAVVVGVAIGWWLRGRSGRAEGSEP